MGTDFRIPQNHFLPIVIKFIEGLSGNSGMGELLLLGRCKHSYGRTLPLHASMLGLMDTG